MLTFQREIPVRHRVDVLVAGGGPAGCAAAVAAARQGRSVFLAEGHTCLGGMGTAGLVPAFCQFSDGENLLAAGIGQEILDKLRAAGGTGPDSGVTIRAEVLKRLYDDLLLDAGVEFTFQTRLIAVEADGERVTHAVLAAKSGLFAIEAKAFVDATGDGDLAAWAGAPFEKGDADGRMMPGTLCNLWAEIDWDRVREGGRARDDSRLEDAFADKVFTHDDRHLSGMSRVGTHVGAGNVGHTFGVDGTDERSLTEALVWARKSMPEFQRYYSEYLKGFERMELIGTGSLLGLRETRRIVGDYVLCLADFERRAVFDDEIGRYCYPVDIHPLDTSLAEFQRFKREFGECRYGKGESYGIPYRALTPRGLANVVVAGRCLSADRSMQSSMRVMPGCYITGQAAGVAAAMSAEGDGDVRGFPVAALQQRLKAIGAYLPNA